MAIKRKTAGLLVFSHCLLVKSAVNLLVQLTKQEDLFPFHSNLQDGATCLFLAAQNGHAKVVSLILAIADSAKDSSALLAEEMINIRRLDGATPLYMSAQMGFDYVVRLLLSAGANPNIVRNVRDSPIRHSCSSSISFVAFT